MHGMVSEICGVDTFKQTILCLPETYRDASRNRNNLAVENGRKEYRRASPRFVVCTAQHVQYSIFFLNGLRFLTLTKILVL